MGESARFLRTFARQHDCTLPRNWSRNPRRLRRSPKSNSAKSMQPTLRSGCHSRLGGHHLRSCSPPQQSLSSYHLDDSSFGGRPESGRPGRSNAPKLTGPACHNRRREPHSRVARTILTVLVDQRKSPRNLEFPRNLGARDTVGRSY